MCYLYRICNDQPFIKDNNLRITVELKLEKDFLEGRNITNLLQFRKAIKISVLILTIIFLLLPLSTCSADCISNNNSVQLSSIPQNSLYISDLDISLNVKASDNIIVSEEYTFFNSLNTSIDSISLNLNMTYSDLFIENSITKTRLDYDFLSSSEETRVLFNSSLEVNSSKTIKMTYNLVNELPLIPDEFSYYMFSYLTTLPFYTHETRVIARLPEYCYLHETDDFPPYSPHNITSSFLSGTRITLIWNFDELSENSILDIRVFFDEPLKSTPIWFFIVGPIAGITIGVMTSFYFFRRKDQKNVRKIGDMFLTDVQKTLLRLIYEKGGKITQTELCKITGYTRTRVSRNLISLEQQELIRREKWGRNFQVYLLDLGRKVIE